jgi:hypothetical protein
MLARRSLGATALATSDEDHPQQLGRPVWEANLSLSKSYRVERIEGESKE